MTLNQTFSKNNSIHPYNFEHFQGSIISLFLYDATYLYLTLLNESIAEGKDPRNGTYMFEKSRNRTFHG